MAKVLVVDHERRIRRWLTDSLGKCGYDVVETANGQTALETASRQRFDLILLDDALPKMDGWQVLTKLKEDPQMQRIPVVLLTSFPSEPVSKSLSHLWRGENDCWTIVRNHLDEVKP